MAGSFRYGALPTPVPVAAGQILHVTSTYNDTTTLLGIAPSLTVWNAAFNSAHFTTHAIDLYGGQAPYGASVSFVAVPEPTALVPALALCLALGTVRSLKQGRLSNGIALPGTRADS